MVMGAALAIALGFQFRARRYVPSLYWVSVVLISVVGTLITDNMVDNFGISLWVTTIGFASALAATFATWYASEKTLSVHAIHTTKREAFYWSAILFTFALGTAAGDLLAEGLNLGYWKSAVMFAGAIGLVAIARFQLGMSAVLAFWAAYVLTRPLGASLGDFLSQPKVRAASGSAPPGRAPSSSSPSSAWSPTSPPPKPTSKSKSCDPGPNPDRRMNSMNEVISAIGIDDIGRACSVGGDIAIDRRRGRGDWYGTLRPERSSHGGFVLTSTSLVRLLCPATLRLGGR